MLKIHANAAQTNAIKNAVAFLVATYPVDTGIGVALRGLKVVLATKIDTLRTIPTEAPETHTYFLPTIRNAKIVTEDELCKRYTKFALIKGGK